MTNLQQLKEYARKKFDKFDNSLLSNGTIASIEICLNKAQSEALKYFIDSLITKAYETGKQEILEKVYVRDYAQKTMENVIDERKNLTK